MVAPARVPEPMLAALRAAAAGALRHPDVMRLLHDGGAIPGGDDRPESGDVIRNENGKWSAAIRAANIQGE